MKKIIYCAVVLIVILALWLCVQIDRYGGVVTQKFQNDRFEIIDAFPLEKIINLHADYPRLLIFGKHRYDKLQGSFPYFLEIPQLHSILFIRSNDINSGYEFVLLNIVSGSTTEIPFGRIIFGTYGFGRQDDYSVKVVSVVNSKILIEDGAIDRKSGQKPLLYEIDFKEKILTQK